MSDAQAIRESKFKALANEYNLKMEEFKKSEKKMKQMESCIELYMIYNGISEYKTDTGIFTIVTKKANILDRSLVGDIEQYFQETEIIMGKMNILNRSLMDDIEQYRQETKIFTRKMTFLNRSLMDDIEQYRQETKKTIMYKALN